MISTAQAQAQVLAIATARPRQTETVRVEHAGGRVLAAPVQALRTQPPFDLSAMDGYALRAAESAQSLHVVGESAAGRPYPHALQPREAVRIFTGAVIPQGADCVLVQEDALREGAQVRAGAVLAAGTFVRQKGRDFTAGAPALAAGLVLDAPKIALIGAMGHAHVPVYARPKIALLSTGDELLAPGETGTPDQIISTNAYALAHLLTQAGAQTRDFGIARDTAASLDAALDAVAEWGADALITSGGASVGAHDLVRPVLEARGAQQAFYKIAMRPGKPLNFGQWPYSPEHTMLVLGLPGNPVSSFVGGVLFARPMVRALAGEDGDLLPPRVPARLGRALKANDAREDYLRASLMRLGPEGAPDPAGALVATAFADQDSSLLSVLAQAQALLIRPAHAPAAQAGEACKVVVL